MLLRTAVAADLDAVVALVDEDDAARAGPGHREAFATLVNDPRNELLVLDDAGEIVGCLQITYIPGLGRGGGERALVEAVRIREDRRGGGLGIDLMRDAIERARARGCALVQLTSNKRRTDAHRFYGALGFTATHEGFK